jgi:hypothetical protein
MIDQRFADLAMKAANERTHQQIEIADLTARIHELERVGDMLHAAARHSDSCGLRYQSHCTCVLATWERLMGRRP